MQLKSSAIKTKSNSKFPKSENKEKSFFFPLFPIITSSIVAAIIGFGAECAIAQITIQTTGTLSGNIQLPKFNPNFNRVVTRVDTNSKGTYSRQGVPLYTSKYVKVETLANGSLHYFVDFKGIPVVSFDGLLTSPALSRGNLTSYNYQGKLPGTKFEAVVQDEFGLKKALYTGIVTDPKTGQRYQGTFKVTGQGPRYSQSNGSATPTVFNFKSDIPGKPTVTSLKVTNAPLIKLFITIPAGTTPINSRSDAGGTPIAVADIPIDVADIPIAVVDTPIAAGVTPIAAVGTPIDAGDIGSEIISPIQSAIATSSNSTKPSAEPNVEFSNGNSSAPNPLSLASNICSRKDVNCVTKPSASKQTIGPRSRVLLR